MLRNEQSLTITPVEEGMNITVSMIHNTHSDSFIEQHDSLEAAIEALTKQYTEEFGFEFVKDFTIQENGSARALVAD